MNAIRLSIFPAAQITAFTAAVVLLPTQAGWATLCLLVAAISMSLSLHVTVHEEVHQPACQSRVLTYPLHGLMTLLIGAPFAGYKWHHWNHHRHNNGLLDFSSTWRDTPDGPIARHLIEYSLLWPATLARAQARVRVEIENGDVPEEILSSIAWQKFLPLIFAVLLGVFVSPLSGVFYLLLVYLGWAFISAHNYSQHPPLEGRLTLSTSCDWTIYNALFYNNGLHYEHHRRPGVPHPDLHPEREAPRVTMPHMCPSRVRFVEGKKT